MRRISFTFALIFSFALAPLATFALDTPTSFAFHGSGYGHGVGLSQMGAKSMALAGATSDEILQYYFKDISIEALDDSQILRVNVGHMLRVARFSTATAEGVIELFDGDISDKSGISPLATIDNKGYLRFTMAGSNALPKIVVGNSVTEFKSGKIFTIRWSGTRYLAGVDSVVTLSQSGVTNKYRYGQMQLKVVKTGTNYYFEITNSVRLADEYLWGVSEMPSYWPIAALEAQVIASRSYALSKAGIIRKACDCDLYGKFNDQVFIGYSKELEKKYGQVWKSTVTNTTGLTLTQAGIPITAYFFSSSGGKTESALNAWGSERAYTQTVDDPGSLDIALNPNYVAWDREISAQVIATAFVLPDVISLEILGRNESGTVSEIRATSSSGAQAILSGEKFRSKTKIPSAWFDLISVQN